MTFKRLLLVSVAAAVGMALGPKILLGNAGAATAPADYSSVSPYIQPAFELQPTLVQDSENRIVSVQNGTDRPIVDFYASNKDDPNWQNDLFMGVTLFPGDVVNMNIDDGMGYCIFDFKAVNDLGQETTEFGVNVCEVVGLTIY